MTPLVCIDTFQCFIWPVTPDDEEATNPVRAIELYCAITEDWATTILTGGSLHDSYPIAAEPTEEHARMLMRRVEFIREKLIPQARSYAPSNSH
jgi:hypothetical protein